MEEQQIVTEQDLKYPTKTGMRVLPKGSHLTVVRNASRGVWAKSGDGLNFVLNPTQYKIAQ